MFRKAFLQALLLFVLLALPVTLFLLRRASQDSGDTVPVVEREAETTSQIESNPGVEEPSGADKESASDPDFEGWERQLSNGQAALERWRAEMMALPRAEAVALLEAYLASGRDLPLGLPFAPGRERGLASAPTARTAVLDLLGRLDPQAAYNLAARALEGPKISADEYALHLRNYAWGAPLEEVAEVRAYLTQKTIELIQEPRWQALPSEGYQEAFDVLVWANHEAALPVLSELLEPGVAIALTAPAGIAMERLNRLDPLRTLDAIATEESFLGSSPSLRAQYAARADFGVEAERGAVEAYFLDPERTGAERDRFLAMVPNLNLTLSYNLLSEVPATYSGVEVRTRLKSTQMTLESWLQDARFEAWHALIDLENERLQNELSAAPSR